ncbi:MAG TPA: signal peptidase II [Planctomycetaceae bacterium]|nr:signal peptidase II [Planctomycetaceae bacterium]
MNATTPQSVSTETKVAKSADLNVQIPRSRYVVFLSLFVLGTFWDLYTKATVFESLGYPGGISLWTQSFLNSWVQFRFYTSFNEGALWGMGQGYSAMFAILSIGAGIGILCWLFWFRAAKSLWLTITLGLVMAGTMGNLYDRLGWHGYEVAGRKMFAVRDFLAFTFGNYHYPIFNFADVFLVTGAIMLAFYSIFLDLPESKPKKKSESTAETT